MANANVIGIKTQTGRLRGLKDINQHPDDFTEPFQGFDKWVLFDTNQNKPVFIKCPYGHPGDIIWQRENFNTVDYNGSFSHYIYQADFINLKPGPLKLKWKPNIHMPRKACRFYGEITDIQLKRLSKLTESECIAEGIVPIEMDPNNPEVPLYPNYLKPGKFLYSATESYMSLISKINGPEVVERDYWFWWLKYKPIDIKSLPK